MAALGLGVDVRVLANVGGRVTAAVTLSLLLLLAISIGLILICSNKARLPRRRDTSLGGHYLVVYL